jgi:DNA-binding MarR family transcriptional regulator
MASTGFLLARVGSESRRRWTRALSSVGLRPSHYAVLMVLSAIGEASQQQLAAMIGVDPRNAVPIIDQLEERALLVRSRDPDDRRRHSVRLTPEGHEAMRRLRVAGEKAERELLAELSPEEEAQLHALLLKLLPGSGPKGLE